MIGKWTKPLASNDYNRAIVLAHIGWWGTVIIVGARTLHWLPQSASLLALLTLGLGVTASLGLSRMRLAETITQVFQVGLQSAITLSANVFTDTCIMALDNKGRITSVDHADAIGWSEGEMVGRELRSILAPRSHGIRVLRPGTSMTSPMLNQKGETFDARLSFAALKTELNGGGGEHGEAMIVTVSPVVAINAEGNYK
jgi:hypothetical protein